MTNVPAGGMVCWSGLVQPSYRTIDLRTVVTEAVHDLPEPPHDHIHLVTAQDVVEVRLTIAEYDDQPERDTSGLGDPTSFGTIGLPAGLMYVDPPGAPLPDRIRLSGPGIFAYACYHLNGGPTESAVRETLRGAGASAWDLPSAVASLVGHEEMIVLLWAADIDE